MLVIYLIKMTSFDNFFLNKAHLLNSECIRYFEIKFAQIKKKERKKEKFEKIFLSNINKYMEMSRIFILSL